MNKRITILEWANMPQPRPLIKHPYDPVLVAWFGETIFYDKDVTIHEKYVNVCTLCSGLLWPKVRSYPHNQIVEIIGERKPIEVSKECESHDKALAYQRVALERRYTNVEMIVRPMFKENGVYVWEVI